jgi:glycosyltransferase involved in cell wall biosynthesis
MNVLVLQSELGVLRGGGENFTKHLFTAFAERGHRVSAAFIADRHGKYSLPLPPSVEPIPLPGWWSRKLAQAALSSMGRYIPYESRLRTEWDRIQEAICWRTIRLHDRRFQRRIKSEFRHRWTDFDAVYVHGNSLLASHVARHRPTILRLPGPVTAELEPQLRAVHMVCANGDALIKIQSFLGRHATELPIGLDKELFRPGPTSIRSKLGWSERNSVIGYVGRLTHLKGVDLLAAAFKQLSKHLANAKLLIVGSGEEERNIRSDLANEFKRDFVHIEADVNHEELPDWYRAMDILVMPSRYENFSNALLEGMGCGIPFLASNVGGNRSLAEIGAGWLFEPDSASSLSSCLQDILQQTGELEARGMIGFNYAKKHSWAATAKRLEQIFERIL